MLRLIALCHLQEPVTSVLSQRCDECVRADLCTRECMHMHRLVSQWQANLFWKWTVEI